MKRALGTQSFGECLLSVRTRNFHLAERERLIKSYPVTLGGAVVEVGEARSERSCDPNSEGKVEV